MPNDATLGVHILGDATSLKASLAESRAAVEKFGATYKAAFAGMADSTLRLEVAENRLAAATARYGAGSVGAAQATMRYRREVDALRERQLATAASVGRGISYGITLPTLIAGAAAVKLRADFENTMQQIVGLSGVSQAAVNRFKDEVLKLAPAVGKSPQELAQALYFITSSGVPAAKAMDVLAKSAQASAAGLGDTQTVADAVTSAINAYGAANMTAQHATDVLVATVREGKGEAADFAGVIGNVTAIASQLGVSFNDVGAALAAETRLGTDAETSATQLMRVFTTLLKVTPQSEKAFEKVGLSAKGLREELKDKGLLATLETVKTAFAGKLPLLTQAFGDQRAIRGVLALVGNQAQSTEQIFERMKDTTGSLGTAFDAVSKDSLMRFRRDLAKLEVDLVKIGAVATPVAVKLADAIAGIADAFGKLPGPVKEVAAGILVEFAIGGPILLGLVGIRRMVASLAGAFPLLGRSAITAAAETEGALAGVEASAAGAAAEVSALRLSLLGLGGLAIAPIVIPIVAHLLKSKPDLLAPGVANVGEENGHPYKTVTTIHGTVRVPISPLEAARLNGLRSTSSGAAETNASPRGSARASIAAENAAAAERAARQASTAAAGPSASARLATEIAEARLAASRGAPGAQSRLDAALRQQIAADERGIETQRRLIAKGVGNPDEHSKNIQRLMADEAGLYDELNAQAKKAGDAAAKAKKEAQQFALPLSHQVAEARADALAALNPNGEGPTALQLKLAREAKATAMKAINGHHLTMQALIDAWNIVNQANQTLAQKSSHQAAEGYKKLSSVAFASSIAGLSREQRIAVESRYAQAQAHNGFVPTGPAAQGIVINGDINLPGVTNHKQFLEELQRMARSSGMSVRGRHGGTRLGIG